ncbi:MAG: ABC transporter substrate-binding protein [Pigmentiphaga sp.]|uniref:ABC transporter substrate-binding protein n=1 Tax=Pigmentiphaga sp. TaxID=1977564 RepID=UPI0029B1EBFA|nr:ABC transporter substrate-binding protein [Pigmentiphaga sp.]MDX3907639.1 ABC transporter substrate-binding protein [Pigmentiphaga sp.]
MQASTPATPSAPSPRVPVRFACGLYDRMQALYTGEVVPEGIDLQFVNIDAPRKIFDRMAGEQAFDVSELSTSEFITRMSMGDDSFVAIPVFPSRTFRHSFITVNRRSGIRSPKDLEGKRIGVPLYTMTAAVWIRGHLQDDFGVDFSSVTWVEGSINSATSHGTPSLMPLVREVAVERGYGDGKSLSQLLDEGKIDAIFGTTLPECRRHNPEVQRLFPDFREVEKAYYRRTGIFPIMHLVAIRKPVYQQHPFIAQSLYRAFNEAKQLAYKNMRNLAALRYMLPWLPDDLDELDEVFGADPWTYGLEANRHTLSTLMRYMKEQGLIRDTLPVDQLFVPVQD